MEPAGEDREMLDLIDAIADWEWTSDAEGRVAYLSPGFEAWTGMPTDRLLGTLLLDVASTATGAPVDATALADRRRFRDLLVRLDGPGRSVVWLELAGTPRHEEGRFRGYRGIGRVVTDRIVTAQSVKRHEQLLDTASDWFWEMDTRNRLTYLSSNVEAVLGLPVSAYIGKRLSDTEGVIIEDDAGLASLAAIRARQPYRNFIYARKLQDGRLVWVNSAGMPYYDANGMFQGYRGTARDVTAEIEAERKLRESERQFRELFEIAADHYWENDANHRVTYISPNYEALTGIPASEIVGRRLDENPRIAIAPEMGRKAVKALKARQPYRDFVYSYQHPDGRKRWISLSGAPIFGADGESQGYRGVGADITARVEAEQAARLGQRRLHDAVSHVTQPFVVFDVDNRVVAFNQAFVDVHRRPGINTPVCEGLTYDALIDWRLKVGFYADGREDEPIAREDLLEAFQDGIEHTYHLADGRWMMAVYRRLPGDGRVGVWTDVTAIKRAEAERRILEQQLHHSQRLEALGTLAGGVAHELNNAMVPIIALTKTVARKLPEESRERHNLTTVIGAAERSRDLVGQILAFSRREDQHARESIDPGQVLRRALTLLRATVASSIQIKDQIDAVSPIDADAGQLEQIVINLVNNAAQAIGETMGMIEVGLRQLSEGGDLCLSVADSGCGMDEATKARIFEPFFTTKGVGKGTGLGLSVVHGIVKDHGGRIEVESAPGQGTRFDVILPITPR
jgi:PAS domain S-box-containing protein